MPISVRLPLGVEQKLADYCVSHKVTKSDAVKQALENMLETSIQSLSPYELGKDIFERDGDLSPKEDLARHSKTFARDRVRGATR